MGAIGRRRLLESASVLLAASRISPGNVISQVMRAEDAGTRRVRKGGGNALAAADARAAAADTSLRRRSGSAEQSRQPDDQTRRKPDCAAAGSRRADDRDDFLIRDACRAGRLIGLCSGRRGMRRTAAGMAVSCQSQHTGLASAPFSLASA